MWFKIINNKKFLLISIFVFLYLALNLFDGERGLISYFEKRDVYEKLNKNQKNLNSKILQLEHKNSLLTENLDLDYIEILIREKFLFQKEGEKIYLIKSNEN